MDITAELHVVAIAIVVERIAQQLLLLGEDISVLSECVELSALIERAPVGVEVVLAILGFLLILVPNICTSEELSVVGLGVVNHRVTHHLVVVVTHLHLVYADNLVLIREDVATVRLDHIIATCEHTTARVATDIGLGIEDEVVGQKRSIAIHHLDNLRVDSCSVGATIILGTITIDVGRASLNQDISEALDMALIVAHRTIGRNNRSIMICSEVSHHDHNLLAVMHHLPALIGLHIDIVALLLG